MTSQEQAAAKKVSALMRAARKSASLTQVNVSQRLGISQSALSKMESGFLIPSAPQWFEFCTLTKIHPDCLTSGYIESNKSAVLEHKETDSGFRLPARYADFRGSKARAMLPFLMYFRESMGNDAKLAEYLKTVKVDPDYFVDLDNQVNLNFLLDMMRTLISKGHFKSRDMNKLTKSIASPSLHGNLHRAYDAGSSGCLIKILIANSKQYECNFRYTLEEEKRNKLVLSVAPEKHLKQFNYRNDSDLGNFLCQYKQSYFEKFSTYAGSTGLVLSETECHYKNEGEKCIYELHTAA